MIYSCGGTVWELAARGDTPLIVTVCGGDPPDHISAYAQSLHDRWGTSDPSQVLAMVDHRRQEDFRAAACCGASVRHWDIPDCIYRRSDAAGWHYEGDEAIFGDLHPAEDALISQLADRFAALVQDIDPAQLFIPMTLGHHVDHLLVRAAAEKAIDSELLVYYADYPYVRDPGALDVYEASADWLPSIKFSISEAGIQARMSGMAAYKSQISTFWADETALRDEITALFAASGNLEVHWKRQPIHN